MTDEFSSLDATAQAALVRKGEVKPIELVEAAIARIERINPELNAVIIPLFEKARALATSQELPRGPFHGVPFLIKDLLLQTKGDAYHAGTRFLRALGWVSDHDTFLAEKLRSAGFVFVGKTNVPELGPVPATEPETYGPSRNPWNLEHSTGGSSGGSAAAVASGMVPVAHGNDGGGSIRIPSSECGLVGLKPSRGRTSLGPDLGEYWAGAAIEHVLTRSVRDTAAILDLVSGWMPGDPYAAPAPVRPFLEEVGAPLDPLRVGLMTDPPVPDVVTHDDCGAAVREAATLLASLGHRVEESHPAALESPEFSASTGMISVAGVSRDIDMWGEKIGRDLGADDMEAYTWMLTQVGREVSARDYLRAVEIVDATTREVAQWWEDGYDVLITPTLPVPPPRLGECRPSGGDVLETARWALAVCAFTMPFNHTGQPAISLPLHWNEGGLPIGVQMVGAYGREDLLIRLAAQLEAAKPWKDRRPPIFA
jgi:amidase